MGHIELSRAADLIMVVAPATADLMAKMAGGHADDLASTTLLDGDGQTRADRAVDECTHVGTSRLPSATFATLQADGVLVVGPNEG